MPYRGTILYLAVVATVTLLLQLADFLGWCG